MKKLPVFLLLLAAVACTSKEKGFVVSVTVDGINEGVASIRAFQEGDYQVLDSAGIDNGTAILKATLAFPTFAYIDIEGMRGSVGLFLDNAKIDVAFHKDSLNKAVVRGSAVHDELRELLDPFDQQQGEVLAEYYKANEVNDTAAVREILSRFNGLYETRSAAIQDFIDRNKASVVTPYLIRMDRLYEMGWQTLDSLSATLDPSLTASPYVQFFKERVELLKKVDVGQPAPDFSQNDSLGNPLFLSSLIGKSELLLIDFWAAWCGPCRAENPNIVAIYNDYHDKGFDVLGVSLDQTREAWIEAIHKDNLTWHHVSDLQYWNNEVSRQYGVMAIPHSVLLDKNGTIIAKDLRGHELRNKVAELLD